MSAREAKREDEALLALIRAIAQRDRSTALQMIAAAPALVRAAVTVGATRQAPEAYFFLTIAHYAYAGDTALHLAAAAHQHDVARDLVSSGALVGATNRRGAQPLHYAADGVPGSDGWDPPAQSAVIELLIGAGADPNAVDKSGVAPLHRAVRTRCSSAVRTLVNLGARATGKNKSGSTPLHLAVQTTGRGGSGSLSSQKEQEEIIRFLLEHGARPSDRDASGKAVNECVTFDWIRAILKGG